jgi:hypothetical protein
MDRHENIRERSKKVVLFLASLSLEELLPLLNRPETKLWRVAGRVTDRRVARQVSRSVRKSLGKTLEKFLPMSSHPATKLWASCWESYNWENFSASKLKRKLLGERSLGKSLGEAPGKSLGEARLGE